MDIKEIKINSWLDSPVDIYNENSFYIEDKEDNYAICDTFIENIINCIESEGYSIKDKNVLRDDIIELLYKFS